MEDNGQPIIKTCIFTAMGIIQPPRPSTVARPNQVAEMGSVTFPCIKERCEFFAGSVGKCKFSLTLDRYIKEGVAA